SGPGAGRAGRGGGRLPPLGLVQRRGPGAGPGGGGGRLRVAADDGVDHELRRQVAAAARDDRRPDREILVYLQPAHELLPAHLLQAAHHGRRRVEARGGGADDGVGGEKRQIVHDHTDHLPAASRERRYICVASAGRFSRSSTMPQPYGPFASPGSSPRATRASRPGAAAAAPAPPAPPAPAGASPSGAAGSAGSGSSARIGGGRPARATSAGVAIVLFSESDSASSSSSAATRARSAADCHRGSRLRITRPPRS